MIEGFHQVRIAGLRHTLTHGLLQLVLAGHVQRCEVRNEFASTSRQRQSVYARQDDLADQAPGLLASCLSATYGDRGSRRT